MSVRSCGPSGARRQGGRLPWSGGREWTAGSGMRRCQARRARPRRGADGAEVGGEFRHKGEYRSSFGGGGWRGGCGRGDTRQANASSARRGGVGPGRVVPGRRGRLFANPDGSSSSRAWTAGSSGGATASASWASRRCAPRSWCKRSARGRSGPAVQWLSGTKRRGASSRERDP